MQRASEIQRSLLPKEIPQLAGFEVAGAWRPARTVSGDYYDVFKLGEGKLGLLHCRRGGEGRVGRADDGQCAGRCACLCQQRREPGAVVRQGEQPALRKPCDGESSWRFSMACLISETRTLDYCNAGQIYPILVSQGNVRAVSESWWRGAGRISEVGVRERKD
jgi:phosphoserine phosphatase RsbU/P